MARGGLPVLAGVALSLSLLLLACAAPTEDKCGSLLSCVSIQNASGCGWCWRSSTTTRDQWGGRAGSPSGPAHGSCPDWTFDAAQCAQHVDCPALPDCLNILGTYCAWCPSEGRAVRDPSKCTGTPAIVNASDCPVVKGPQQIHLSFGANATNQVVVTWSSHEGGHSELFFKQGNGTFGTATATSKFFLSAFNLKGCHHVHRATITVLPNTTYTYYVQTGKLQSQQFNFTTPLAGDQWSASFIVYGDMGRFGGGQILDQLNDEVTNGHYTAIIHVGDFAYDMSTDFGVNGDNFLNRIQPLATKVPYMTCVGNHEIEGNTFSNYISRFSMPRWDDPAGLFSQMWHSWDVQLVHFISYSTEVYFADTDHIDTQYKWLEQDLQTANLPANRAARPWIVAYGHRPMYCSNIDHDDCTTRNSVTRHGLEDLFHKYGVDIVIEAHEHSYERLWPVYNETVTQKNYVNPKAAVHFVTGAAGCNENDGACVNAIRGPLGDWSAFRSSGAGTYSFMRMNVANRTHMHVASLLAESMVPEDQLWIEQQEHGPRQLL